MTDAWLSSLGQSLVKSVTFSVGGSKGWWCTQCKTCCSKDIKPTVCSSKIGIFNRVQSENDLMDKPDWTDEELQEALINEYMFVYQKVPEHIVTIEDLPKQYHVYDKKLCNSTSFIYEARAGQILDKHFF